MFNVSDSSGLTVSELAGGVELVTQCGEIFDCHPAVETAFTFTKLAAKDGQEEETTEPTENTAVKEEEEVKASTTRNAEKTLQFDEFQIFLQYLRQYFLFCKVISEWKIPLNCFWLKPSSCILVVP